ncbi:MAG TPA: thermonuclease family protein [Steroidobacteraceae bacterium]|nr:thermonuclease family protein [Steroidobacteraceae bacterium]
MAIDGRHEKVRLIGVDTPETVDPRKLVEYFGVEASGFTKSLLNGKAVELERDPDNANRDKYDRLLRYVWLDGVLVNAEIIAQGYGFAYVKYPFSRMEEFRMLPITRKCRFVDRRRCAETRGGGAVIAMEFARASRQPVHDRARVAAGNRGSHRAAGWRAVVR